MRHGSLFSGIGGFDLAAEWMGWQNIFHCEWNPFGQKILKHYWPDAISYGDITTTDFTVHRGQIDIITGGFPCQPYSVAGKRKGKEDDRHLWPEMLRAIREIQPRWIVGENVPGLLNWERGMVLDEIKADLETAGFEVFPPLILPACGKDAPHRRDRLWIVAYCGSFNSPLSIQQRGQNTTQNIDIDRISKNAPFADTSGKGLSISSCGKQRKIQRQAETFTRSKHSGRITKITRWERFPSQPAFCGGNDGLPSELDGVTISKWRKESLMAAGNSIVPQVVFEIFKAIQQVA